MTKSKSVTWDAKDCALILIDYQPEMFKLVKSTDTQIIELNVCTMASVAKEFKMPIILSTVGVEMGVNKPTIDGLKKILPDIIEIDRSTMNAWEDPAFLKAVKATGKKRLIFGALFTEICLAYPVLDALADDYEVSFLVDAVGGQSVVEHETAVQRLIQAGAVPNTTWPAICELFRDWKSPHSQIARDLFSPYIHERNLYEEGMQLMGH